MHPILLTPAKASRLLLTDRADTSEKKHCLHFSLRMSLCTYNPFRQKDNVSQFCSLSRCRVMTCTTNNLVTDNISHLLAAKSGKCSQVHDFELTFAKQ